MIARLRGSLRLGLASLLTLAIPTGALAQQKPYFEGKTLTVLVGVQVGGTADTVARRFAERLRDHIPGRPTIVVQNMTGAGSNLVFNYFAERAAPDGLTVVFSSYQALAEALGDNSLHAKFEDFDYLGGVSDTRVSYMRTDAVPGGLGKPADIAKAGELLVGSYSNSDFEGVISNLSLKVLGVKHRMVIGYRGGSDIFLAMQRGEIQLHNTSLASFRTRSAAFVRSGEGKGVFYLASVGPDGKVRENANVTEMPSFPALYKEIHDAAPSGRDWDALNWLTSQTSELAYAAFAKRGTPPEATSLLREGFSATARDPEFISHSTQMNGLPYSFVPVERGSEIIGSLTSVTPEILGALNEVMK
jgi:tripartite-type tricarboxylate transporter receptor subunit TctC